MGCGKFGFLCYLTYHYIELSITDEWYIPISGYEGESLTKLLHKIQRSTVVMMDRWQIEFSAPETGEEEQGDPIPCNIINNYFSIGVVSVILAPTANS